MAGLSSTSRWLHSTLAIIGVVPIFVTIISEGEGVDKAWVQWLMSVHTLSFLSLHTVYPVVVALLVLALMTSALPLTNAATFLAAPSWTALQGFIPRFDSPRALHRTMTVFVAVPLSLTTMTGMVWTISRYYLNQSKGDAAYLMELHQGALWMSPVIYTGVLFLLCYFALFPGVLLIVEGQFKKTPDNTTKRTRQD
jgi:hypothetical protein